MSLITTPALLDAEGLFTPVEELQMFERAAGDVLRRYLAEHAKENFWVAYVITTVGIRGRVWKYHRDVDLLHPLKGDRGYSQVHSSEAEDLNAAFDQIKASFAETA
ncbi:hypothetical protein BDV18DRAFT_158169 [Aspergillus unguis]